MIALFVAGGLLSFAAVCVMLDWILPSIRPFAACMLVRIATIIHPFSARREFGRHVVAMAKRSRTPGGVQ